MKGLDVPDSRFVGAFRGEPGLENVQVRVGANYGVDSAKVAGELKRFEAKVQTLIAELDALLPIGQEPDADQLAAIVDLCAWSHAEWMRIHPFANGNGRMRAFGPTASQCVMVCRLLSACARDPMQVTGTPARKQCRATGNQLRLPFADCSRIF